MGATGPAVCAITAAAGTVMVTLAAVNPQYTSYAWCVVPGHLLRERTMMYMINDNDRMVRSLTFAPALTLTMSNLFN